MLGVYVTVPVACFRKGLSREYLETEPLPPPATCYGFLLSLVGETDRRRHVGCRVAPVLLNSPPTSVVLRTVWRVKEQNYWQDSRRNAHVLGAKTLTRLREWLRAAVAARLLGELSGSGNETAASLAADVRRQLSDLTGTLDWGELVLAWIQTEADPPLLLGRQAKDFFKEHRAVKTEIDRWLQNNDQFVVGLGCGENARPDYQQLLTGVRLLLWLDSAGEKSAAPNLETRVATALADPGGITRFGGLSLGESTHLVDEVSPWDRVRDRLAGRPGRAFLVAERGRLTLPVWVDHVGSAGTRYATGDLEEVPLSSPPATDRLPVISPE